MPNRLALSYDVFLNLRRCAQVIDAIGSTGIRAIDPSAIRNAEGAPVLGNTLNVSFPGIDGERLFDELIDVAVSSGSACTSATLEPSYVLKALGAGDDLAHSSIRFGIGRFNTEEEVDYVAAKVIDVVKKLREMMPRVRDDALHRDLAEMLESHVTNIARANEALESGGR